MEHRNSVLLLCFFSMRATEEKNDGKSVILLDTSTMPWCSGMNVILCLFPIEPTEEA